MKVIAVSFLVFSAVLSAHAGPLWGKTESRQSLDEVKALYPHGNTLIPNEKQKLRSGAVLQYEVNDIDVGGDSYVAQFYFQPNGLEQVSLVSRSSIDDSGCDAKYAAVKAALSGKYGAPVDTRGTRPSQAFSQTTFSKHGMKIGLVGSAGVDRCTLHISYISNDFGVAGNL